MSKNRTPTINNRAWKNADYDYEVVQALPQTIGTPASSDYLTGYPCQHCTPPESIASWIFADRKRVRHLLRKHIVRANRGLLRFSSKIRGQYACDLVFEIDAHVKGLGLLDYQAYEPIIRAATTVGRRIYDHLVTELEVDPRYITTTVTRQGARVTVDWRAFGPQVLHDLLIVTRYIGELVVPDLAELEKVLIEEAERENARLVSELSELGIPAQKLEVHLVIDGNHYKKSDRPRLDSDGNISWAGPFLRPIGSLHSATDHTTLYARATPVPHDKFRPENTPSLVRVSRSKRPEISSFAEPELFVAAHRYPEARDPAYDHLIEDANVPRADKLIALFAGAEDLVDGLSPEAQEEVKKARPKPGGALLTAKQGITSEVTPEVIARVIAAIPRLTIKRAGTDKHRVNCPYCNKGDGSATLYLNKGWFTCFRCHPDSKGIPLANLARDHGVGHLVPTIHRSSAASRLVDASEIPLADPCQSWASDDIMEPVFETVDELRADMDRRIRDFVASDYANEVLVLSPGTGTGKTTTSLQALATCGKQVFGSFPRDDNKPPMLDLIPASRLLTGRRPGDNCANPDAEDARKRRVPSGEWCGPKVCDYADGCPYLAQFQDADGVSFAGHHAHLPLLANENFGKFLNNSEIVFIDENPFNYIVENIDLTASELDLFRCVPALRFGDADRDGFGLDDAELTYAAPTQTIETIISGLEAALGGDAVLSTKLEEINRAEGGKAHVELHRIVLADAPLTRHLSGEKALVQALRDFDLEDQAALLRAIRPSKATPATPSDPEPVPEVEVTPEMLAACERTKPRVKIDQPRRPTPIRILPELVGALTDVVAGIVTTPAMLVRRKRGWLLRLALRRSFAVPGVKTILASASVRPEQVRLMFGADAKVTVYAPKVRDPKVVTVIADHTYSQTQLEGEKKKETRTKVFETVKARIESEFQRTGLPTAVIGSAALMNLFNEFMLGKEKVKDLAYPFSSSARSKKKEALREPTLKHHYLAGYSRAVEGSNDFGIEQDGRFRFVRSLVVLGSMLPPVGDIEANFRGVYAGDAHYITVEYPGIGPLAQAVHTQVDWTPVHRIVPFDGQEVEGKTLAATQVVGFADARANEILHASYEAVILQVIGRLRSVVPDPVDPTIEPRVLVIGAVSVPGLNVDRVASLADVREELGLEVERGKGRSGRPKSWKPTPDKLRDYIRQRSRPKAVERTAKYFADLGLSETEVLTNSRFAIEKLGLDWTAADRRTVEATLGKEG